MATARARLAFARGRDEVRAGRDDWLRAGDGEERGPGEARARPGRRSPHWEGVSLFFSDAVR